jgi:hypothetical protein
MRVLKRYKIKSGLYAGETAWFYENAEGKMVPDGPKPWESIADDPNAVWDKEDLEELN